jgi:hypothetical protein
MKYKGGLYHSTQIEFAYNSNHLEGSALTKDETRYIYETNSIAPASGDTVNVDDVIEAKNHFRAFNHLLDIADEKLTEGIIKEFHAHGAMPFVIEDKNRIFYLRGIEHYHSDKTQLKETIRHEQDVFKKRYEKFAFPASKTPL